MGRFFYSLISTYVEFFFGFVLSILIARNLGPDDYGIYSYLFWWLTFFLIIVNGGVSVGAIKFIAEARGRDNQEGVFSLFLHFSRIQLKKLLTISSILGFIIYFFYNNIGFHVDVNIYYILLIGFSLKTLYMFNVSIMKGFEDFRGLAFIVLIVSPVNLLLIMSAIYFGLNNLDVYILIYCIVTLLSLLLSYFFRYKRLKQADRSELKIAQKKQISNYLWRVSWVSILCFIVLRQSELFFLKMFSVSSDLAYYNVGFSVAYAASALVPGIYSSLLLPLMAKKNQKGKAIALEQLKTSLRYMVYLNMGLLFPIVYFASQIILLFYGKSYAPSVLPLQVISICASMKVIYECINAYLMSIDKQSFILKVISFVSFLTLTLDYFLIKDYQLSGALMALSISTSILVCAYILFICFSLKLKLEWLIYLKSVFSGAVAITIVHLMNAYNSNLLFMCFFVGIYLIFYTIFMILFNAFTRIEIGLISIFNDKYLHSNLLAKYFDSKYAKAQ